ncbi:MAG: hypothetical protein ACOYXB_14200 [Bacteroidota bacterium]
MKKLSGIVLLVFAACTLYGQDGAFRQPLPDSLISGNEVPRVKAPVFGFSAGSSFLWSPGFGSASMLYAAPGLTYPVSQRFSVHAGVLTTLSYPIGGSGDISLGNPQPMTSLSLYAAASYRLDDRLTVYGAGIKQIVGPDLKNPGPMVSFGSDSYTLGASYRLGRNVTIGAAVVVNNRSTAYPFAPANGVFNPLW